MTDIEAGERDHGDNFFPISFDNLQRLRIYAGQLRNDAHESGDPQALLPLDKIDVQQFVEGVATELGGQQSADVDLAHPEILYPGFGRLLAYTFQEPNLRFADIKESKQVAQMSRIELLKYGESYLFAALSALRRRVIFTDVNSAADYLEKQYHEGKIDFRVSADTVETLRRKFNWDEKLIKNEATSKNAIVVVPPDLNEAERLGLKVKPAELIIPLGWFDLARSESYYGAALGYLARAAGRLVDLRDGQHSGTEQIYSREGVFTIDIADRSRENADRLMCEVLTQARADWCALMPHAVQLDPWQWEVLGKFPSIRDSYRHLYDPNPYQKTTYY